MPSKRQGLHEAHSEREAKRKINIANLTGVDEEPRRPGWKSHGKRWVRGFTFYTEEVDRIDAFLARHPVNLNDFNRFSVMHTIEQIEAGMLELPTETVTRLKI